jgi:A/G-specific adenine glycosylase
VKPLVPRLLQWFAANARDLPWRRTRDPYAIWISEIMLQQTQVVTVIPYWERWLRELPDVASLARADEARLHKLWEGLGYYTRVRNLQRAARLLEARHGGEFPRTFADVLALPGIGRYTAGALCSIAFNQPTPIVDGNVARVLTRVFGIGTELKARQTQARLWALAESLVRVASEQRNEPRACSHLNQSLMELGAVVCTPRSPGCNRCPLRRPCAANRAGLPEQYPVRGPGQSATARRFVAFVVERGGKLLVRQRPAGVVNAGLWEFPNVEVDARRLVDPGLPSAQSAAAGSLCHDSERIGTIKHSITRYRITLEVVRVPLRGLPEEIRRTDGRWCSLKELEALAFTSAHRRIVRHLAAAT